MDAAAVTLARENKIPIVVFSIHHPNALPELMAGRGVYTVIGGTD
jgi:uridylate kinase